MKKVKDKLCHNATVGGIERSKQRIHNVAHQIAQNMNIKTFRLTKCNYHYSKKYGLLSKSYFFVWSCDDKIEIRLLGNKYNIQGFPVPIFKDNVIVGSSTMGFSSGTYNLKEFKILEFSEISVFRFYLFLIPYSIKNRYYRTKNYILEKYYEYRYGE